MTRCRRNGMIPALFPLSSNRPGLNDRMSRGPVPKSSVSLLTWEKCAVFWRRQPPKTETEAV